MKPGYVTSMMQHIIAFEIELTNIEHVFKLSQNRDEQSQASIITHLQQNDNPDAAQVADEMEKK